MTAIKKLVTGLTTVGILTGSLVTPAFAQTVEITDNGAKSHNTVVVSSTCISGVKQSNKTEALTEINASSYTGGNQASGNTGGNTSVDTGDATTTVAVLVTGGSNEATAPSCCECAGGVEDVTVSGNGFKSVNTVLASDTKITGAKQKTKTSALTGVSAAAKTGKNKAKFNTGTGTTVTTGAALTEVLVTVDGGSNTLNP